MSAPDIYDQRSRERVIAEDSTVTLDFDEASWDMAGSLALSTQLSTGRTLIKLAERGHDDLVVCTADLGRPTQVIDFGRRYPERYYNFGIAERNMIGAAAGLATTGWLPVISNYSFFLALMGLENIRNDICYPNLKVRLVGTHSGIAMGFYGTSHHSNEDIGALRALANLVLMAPCDANAIEAALTATIDHEGPIYFRCGRGRETPVYATPPDWRIGGSNRLRAGKDATILASGVEVAFALEAADQLAAEGIEVEVLDMYSIRPIDETPILEAARRHGRLFTAEEHNVTGGFASAVADVLADHGVGAKLTRIGLPDSYAILGPPTHLYRHYAMDGAGIAERLRRSLRGDDRS